MAASICCSIRPRYMISRAVELRLPVVATDGNRANELSRGVPLYRATWVSTEGNTAVTVDSGVRVRDTLRPLPRLGSGVDSPVCARWHGMVSVREVLGRWCLPSAREAPE
ncbi:hypothetical protein BDW59DRAFT_168018 [Aspergillus cavernicola]|uniref:Uncharacterized protein n=1 Tax=Aspergillus cavernicola TaxID=176166 RepID=A0ABR4H7C3_9EURO